MRIVNLALCSAVLVGCGGGYDDLPPKVSNNKASGGTDYTGDSNSNDADWKYRNVTNDEGEVFSVSATIYATNTYQSPNYSNLQMRPYLVLDKKDYTDSRKDVSFFAREDVACSPSCEVKIKINGTTRTYSMTTSIDSVITPLNNIDKVSLYQKLSSANSAFVELPIIGLKERFKAEFNLRGFDAEEMLLTDEGREGESTIAPIQDVSCSSFATQAQAQAYYDAKVAGYQGLGKGGVKGVPCENLP